MLHIAISPCPNDTYLFWGWICGQVGQTLPITPYFADIDRLNQCAMSGNFPLMKVSINMYGHISDRYMLLPVGAALGYGVGPKIVSSDPHLDFSQAIVAIPGKETTAHLLFDLFFQAKEKVFCTYDSIFSLLHEGIVDAGVIIHESRFTFQKEGLYEVADLGKLWERRFSLPLPLGGIVLRKDFGHFEEICDILQQSLLLAKNRSDPMFDFILSHSQEKDRSVVQKHIDLYVTDETFELSSKGKDAIQQLILCGRNLGYYK